VYSYPYSEGANNLPGQWRFFFLEKENVTNIPKPVENGISTAITVSHDWYEGLIIYNTDDLTYKLEDTGQGARYVFSLKGSISQVSRQYEYLFHKKRNREFILLLQDFNGQTRVVGNTTKGVKFTFNTIKGGYTFEYSGSFTEPLPFYEGPDFVVDGVAVSITYSTASPYIRTTRWLTGSGAPSNSTGQIYDFYIDTLTTNYYKKESGGWQLVGQLVDQELQEIAYYTAALQLTGNL
jgi:hypothetical protein